MGSSDYPGLAGLFFLVILILDQCPSSQTEGPANKLYGGSGHRHHHSGGGTGGHGNSGTSGRSGKPQRNRPPGRHVCLQNHVVTKPVKQLESYCKPVYKSQMYPCEKDSNKFCTSFRVVYERAYRTVFKITAQNEEQYTCCPGWSRHHPSATGCNKPVCSQVCSNGGTCSKPDHCVCPPGWTGKTCEEDVDECKNEISSSKCEQKCLNSPGSFRCSCHEGFVIENDGVKCKININRIPEITEFIQSYEELSKKVQILEKLQEQQNTTELVQRLDDLSNAVDHLKEQMATKLESTTTKAPEIELATSPSPSPSPSPSTSSSPTERDDGFDSRYGSPWDRINSLSEQISMLEERLEDCTCKNGQGFNYRIPTE